MTPFIGFCRISRGDDLFELVAAVLCNNPTEFEQYVSAELAQEGYWLHWANNVMPLEKWTARYPTHWGAVLADGLTSQHPVVMGPITPLKQATPPLKDWLNVNLIGSVVPLDFQFAVDPPKTVPDILLEPLFGQPEPAIEADRLNTYAVLDASKFPYILPELLEHSDLHFQSLFQGEAQAEIGTHAPYLVQLLKDNHFTRRLFTGPEGVNGIWHRVSGLFIRTSADFNTLRHHLRKFTRVQDEQGKWFYFRFWEAGVSARSLWLGNHVDLHPLISPFFPDSLKPQVIVMLDDEAVQLSRIPGTKPSRSTPLFTQSARSAMRDIRRTLQFQELIEIALTHAGITDAAAIETATQQLNQLRSLFFSLGFWRRDHLVKLCVWELLLGPNFLRNFAQGRVWEVCQLQKPPHETLSILTELIKEEGEIHADESDET
ncbi:DUF4123 domain-containing protein [Nitrincola lacisaponensis]|nr:DUF4123 domain-containing protein [Nitrincola lacisaponensis]